MYPDYTPIQPRKPKRKILGIVLGVIGLLVVTAVIGYVATMGVTKQLDDNAVRDELITQNKQLKASKVDGVISEDAIARTKSTDRAVITLAITSDRTSYCIEATSPKNADAVRFHMDGDTPELEPVAGLCGEAAKNTPDRPTAVVIESTAAKSVTLSWSVLPNAAVYLIECAISNAFTTIDAKAESNTARGTVSGLKESVQYFCRVAAKNSQGQSGWSEPVRTKTQLYAYSPVITVTTLSSSALSYKWEPIAGATSYILEYATDANFTQDVKKVQTSATSGQATGLTKFTVYYFRAKAITANFNETQAPFSPLVQGRTDP